MSIIPSRVAKYDPEHRIGWFLSFPAPQHRCTQPELWGQLLMRLYGQCSSTSSCWKYLSERPSVRDSKGSRWKKVSRKSRISRRAFWLYSCHGVRACVCEPVKHPVTHRTRDEEAGGERRRAGVSYRDMYVSRWLFRHFGP